MHQAPVLPKVKVAVETVAVKVVKAVDTVVARVVKADQVKEDRDLVDLEVQVKVDQADSVGHVQADSVVVLLLLLLQMQKKYLQKRLLLRKRLLTIEQIVSRI